MASIREQILDYIVAQLRTIKTTTPSLENRVHRSRQVPVARNEGVRVVVEPVEEEVTSILSQRMERMLSVRVSIRVHGGSKAPDEEADPIAVAIYAKLMTDTRLGGLAQLPIQERERTFPMEDADGDPIDYQIFFVVPYRTTLASEETAG